MKNLILNLYLKSILFLITGILCSLGLHAQDINFIKNSGRYYWGQGYSDNERIADKQAIENFITEITKQIKDKYLIVNKNQGTSVEDFTKTVLETYSNTSFMGLNAIMDRDASSILTVRFIEKENLSSLFQARKDKILSYFEEAEKAEKELRLSDALQKYYWSYLLLLSHPDNQKLSFTEDGKSIVLFDYLPSKVNQLLLGVSFVFQAAKTDDQTKFTYLTANVFYGRNPVQNLTCKIWSGNGWSNGITYKNGLGVIELSENTLNKSDSIQLQLEYRFESEARIDNELLEILNNINAPEFKSAMIKLPVPVNLVKTAGSSAPVVKVTGNQNTNKQDDISGQILPVVQEIAESIDKKNFTKVKQYFTDEGWIDFNHMTNYGNARLVTDSLDLRVITLNNEYVVRKLPLYFKFKNNNKQFVEDMVFYFNKDLKISGLSFSLSDVAINDIMNKKEEWGTLQDKIQLIQFIENYKTAYCFKRLEFIEKVFDDNALIIVGRSLKNAPVNNDRNIFQLYNNDQIEYIQKSKDAYLKSLETVFKSNEYINIHFEDNMVKRARENDKIFGIQIAQYYTSVNYSDKGYLFLMVDLNDSLNPKIYVRTWQPQKNPDGSVIGLQDFHF